MKRVSLLVATIALVIAPAAFADTIHYEAFLDGLQEVPPNPSPATGMATAILDPNTNQLCVHLEFNGLTSPQTAAHVHAPAPPGQNAGVIMPLTFGSPSDTCAILSDANEANVMNGLSYVNVHSQNFPGGEIRGQLNKVPEPAAICMLALGAMAISRRRK